MNHLFTKKLQRATSSSQVQFLAVIAVLLVLALPACSQGASPSPAPTLAPSVASPLQEQLVGSWHIINGGAWGDSIVTFGADGAMSVKDTAQAMDERGTYAFTAENTISFQFSDSSGTAEIKFPADDRLSLSVMTSEQPFGSIYSAERAEAP